MCTRVLRVCWAGDVVRVSGYVRTVDSVDASVALLRATRFNLTVYWAQGQQPTVRHFPFPAHACLHYPGRGRLCVVCSGVCSCVFVCVCVFVSWVA
jgi:hypothetical protein